MHTYSQKFLKKSNSCNSSSRLQHEAQKIETFVMLLCSTAPFSENVNGSRHMSSNMTPNRSQLALATGSKASSWLRLPPVRCGLGDEFFPFHSF